MKTLSTLFTPRRIALLVAVIVLSVSIPLLIGGRAALHHLASLSGFNLATLLLPLVAKWSFEILRNQMILRHDNVHLTRKDILMMMWLCDAASESTPSGIGGPISAWAILRSRHIPTSTIINVGLLARALDLTVIAGFIIWILLYAATLRQQDAGIHWQLMSALAVMLFILALFWGLLRYQRRLIQYLGNMGTALGIPPATGKRYFKKLIKFWLHLRRALERIAKLPRSTQFSLMLVSIAYWCSRLSVLYVVILALGQPIAWIDAFSIQTITGIASMLVGLPGGYLGADVMMAALLAPLLDIKTIASAILLWRLLTFHASLLVGALSATVWLKGFLHHPDNSRSNDSHPPKPSPKKNQ